MSYLFVGRQDNLAIREVRIVALMFNLLMILGAIVIMLTAVPSAKNRLNLNNII